MDLFVGIRRGDYIEVDGVGLVEVEEPISQKDQLMMPKLKAAYSKIYLAMGDEVPEGAVPSYVFFKDWGKK